MPSGPTTGLHADILDPILIIEDNAAGSFTFTLPRNNWAYGEGGYYNNDGRITVAPMTSEITIERRTKGRWNFERIWGGRVITEEQDFDGNKMFTCEGELN